MKRVILHIDSLVLRGFRNEDREGIAEGLQQELSRLLADSQAAQQLTANGDVSRLKIGSVQIGQGVNPKSVGLQVSHGIARGIKK